ncbi:MAG: STAS domain-containing protein [Rhizonema sp. NSF051]|nr:STAS domain-containing protein [Rhizonema sp. NSF051]
MQSVLSYPKIIVISPQGTLNSANALEFERDLIKALTQDQNTVLLINLEQVESLDNAGLMALVSALKLAQKLERGFSLCSVNPSIQIIFELTQLDRVLQIFANQAAFEAACLSVGDIHRVYA